MNTRLLRPAEILYAEDNEDDFELLRTGLDRSGLKANLHHVTTGIECMQFLRREGPWAGAPRPDLLLLDMNMPLMDGFEVMQAIVDDATLRTLPVVALTTSSAPDDIERMYQLRCSSYIRKPLELQELMRVARTLAEYWFTVVTLPTRC